MPFCDIHKKCTDCERDNAGCPLPNAYAADTEGGPVFLCGRCGDSIAGNYFNPTQEKRCYFCGHVVQGDNIKYLWIDAEEPNFEENFQITNLNPL